MFFSFGQTTTYFKKPKVITEGVGAHPLHPSPRSAPALGSIEEPCIMAIVSSYVSQDLHHSSSGNLRGMNRYLEANKFQDLCILQTSGY